MALCNAIKTAEYLFQIDPELVQYSSILKEKGFSSTKHLAFLEPNDVDGEYSTINT